MNAVADGDVRDVSVDMTSRRRGSGSLNLAPTRIFAAAQQV